MRRRRVWAIAALVLVPVGLATGVWVLKPSWRYSGDGHLRDQGLLSVFGSRYALELPSMRLVDRTNRLFDLSGLPSTSWYLIAKVKGIPGIENGWTQSDWRPEMKIWLEVVVHDREGSIVARGQGYLVSPDWPVNRVDGGVATLSGRHFVIPDTAGSGLSMSVTAEVESNASDPDLEFFFALTSPNDTL